MAILHDPWTGKTVHDDSLPSPLVGSDDNGDYVIRRENGKSSYAKLDMPLPELPAYPTTDGTYVLTCTVDDKVATLSWEDNT